MSDEELEKAYAELKEQIIKEKNIYEVCPLCDEILERNGIGDYFVRSKCPKGHYEYQNQGNYGGDAIIKIDGKEEVYKFDDSFDDSKEFEKRIKELKNSNEYCKFRSSLH